MKLKLIVFATLTIGGIVYSVQQAVISEKLKDIILSSGLHFEASKSGLEFPLSFRASEITISHAKLPFPVYLKELKLSALGSARLFTTTGQARLGVELISFSGNRNIDASFDEFDLADAVNQEFESGKLTGELTGSLAGREVSDLQGEVSVTDLKLRNKLVPKDLFINSGKGLVSLKDGVINARDVVVDTSYGEARGWVSFSQNSREVSGKFDVAPTNQNYQQLLSSFAKGQKSDVYEIIFKTGPGIKQTFKVKAG